MRDDRGAIKCDCCGRQIVKRVVRRDNYIVGPSSEAHNIGCGKHCCGECYPEWKAWTEWEEMIK